MALAPAASALAPRVNDDRTRWPFHARQVDHAASCVWDAVGATAGRATREESELLFELGCVAGSAMLAVGPPDPRAALALLRGALAARDAGRRNDPQLFAIDTDAAGLLAWTDALRAHAVESHGAPFVGDLERFSRELPFAPTLVLIHAPRSPDAFRAALERAARLPAGAPIVCERFADDAGVRAGVQAAADAGAVRVLREIGGAALLVAARGGTSRSGVLEAAPFDAVRASLHERLRAAATRVEHNASRPPGGVSPPADGASTPAIGAAGPPEPDDRGAALRAAQFELLTARGLRGASGRGPWPFARADARPLPATLPDGRPWPKISIVTPSFNQGRYIEETLLSVANQGYPNVEHIVIDGGSTDETRAVIERHRPTLAHVVSERDRGQGDALNKGFRVATGEILTWLNSDDRLAPGALAGVALAFATRGADMVAGICEIWRDDELFEQHLTSCDNGPLPLDELLDIDHCWQGGQFFYQPEVMFSRDLWRRAGGRIDDRWFFSMDYELWLRFAEHGARLHVIGRPVAQFRVHADQKTVAEEKFYRELHEVRREFLARTGHSWQAGGRTFGESRRRIVFFNDMGFNAGAGIAHGRLATACAWAGQEVVPLCLTQSSTYDATPPAPVSAVVARVAEYQPDAVVLGNLHAAALPPALLSELARRWPTMIVLHDQWALTGRCAYTGDCTKHLLGCDDTCPTPTEYPALEPARIAGAFATKRRALHGEHAPVLLANSAWMANFARHSLAGPARDPAIAGPAARVEPIRLGVPTDVFRPRDINACRSELDLPLDRFIVLTSGTSAADPRKGIAHLAAALELLNLPDILVVGVGHFDPGALPPIAGMRAMGYLSDPRQMATLYAAADVFVGPSLQESFGQVFIEAAACGTPAIGYPVGGVPEAIHDGVSGVLATRAEPRALADSIGTLYHDADRRAQLGAWGRMLAENEFSLATAYQRLFVAWDRSGMRDRLGLRRKIRFDAGRPALPPAREIDPSYPGWRAVSGFLDWEGPYPKDNLPRCRWTVGPLSRIEFVIEQPGRYALMVACRNYWEGQRLRLVHDGHVVGESHIPVTRNLGDHVEHRELELAAGVHHVELHHWKWDTHKPLRPTALLITGIAIVPARSTDHPAARRLGIAAKEHTP
ncbi:MAG: glycosyltransferase [Phycisphaerae bacterium]